MIEFERTERSLTKEDIIWLSMDENSELLLIKIERNEDKWKNFLLPSLHFFLRTDDKFHDN